LSAIAPSQFVSGKVPCLQSFLVGGRFVLVCVGEKILAEVPCLDSFVLAHQRAQKKGIKK
jgi:hypothetical protein